MTDDSLFKEGGPHNVKRTGKDTYKMQIEIPPDEDGMVGRECRNEACSPAYFKIKLGTGLTGQEEAYCPYCRYSAAPTGFHTKAQQEYAKQVLTREATKGVQNMLRDTLGFGSGSKRKLGGGLVSLTYKPGHLPSVGRPLEEELRRDLTCPSCGLSHAVFGLAVWCPDCGRDIFLTHVEHEYEVVRKMLSVVEDRRRDLGA